ncbi:sensor domain-containing protein [Mycobacterium sp. pUA109]|uniref:sensor domain-containing protein n=1 Tax=Mycobacterium sp. pUA109 TaxID=3238982 RepID=UPI00351ADA81
MARRRVAVLLLALAVVSGCTRIVDGTVHPASGLTPNPLAGRAVKQVLLDDAELEKMLDQSFESDPNLAPRFGDDAFDERPDVSSPDCALAVGLMQKSSYDSADVRDAAREIWWTPRNDRDATVIDVEEGVVALPSAADADTVFEELTKQWEHRDGDAETSRGDTFTLSRPKVADSVLSANTSFSFDSGTIPGLRALGVRVNCLVEVQVSFYRDVSGEQKNSAVDIAHTMMNKVTDLS